MLRLVNDEESPLHGRKPWHRATGLAAVLSGWADNPRVGRHMVLDATLDPTAASHAPLPPELPEGVRRALAARGIEQLFSHQAESLRAVSGGQSVVVATPTASGKSLCYNLPVLSALATDPQARALYLFPTKALARDQEEALRALLREASLEQGVITFDGDTPSDARRAAKERGGIILTNPDMLHCGILPHHTAWARLFANLKVVVIDELHTYRGVFGSHLANVVRRLRRIARFHGSSPTFVLASATIGNPAEHATRMVGEPVTLIGESGAPTGPKRVLVYNPPVINAELGVRESYIKAAVKLTRDLVQARVPTILFGQSRNNVEVMLKYLRDRLRDDGLPEDALCSYRGGYLPGTRRAIEAGLREGRVLCVVATNALELGIDIGMLDAAVCAGYPGSIAGLWQRFGRAGRRGSQSLALLVTSSSPYDQYCAQHAHTLIGAPVEHARIDPDNVDILMRHLECAAFELPFHEGEAFGDVAAAPVGEALDYLRERRVLHATGAPGARMFHWSSDAYPANHVSLRSAGWDNVVIVEQRAQGDDLTLGEMDFRSAHTMLHEQAIYQHLGQQFQVEALDLDNRKAFVRQVEPDYYTDAMTYVRVGVMAEDERDTLRGTHAVPVGFGEVSVVEKVVGFKKIKYHTHENVGYGEVRLPDMQMHTTSTWFTFPNALLDDVSVSRPEVIDALRGLGRALHTVAVVGLMVDPRDLGHTLLDPTEPGHTAGAVPFEPTLFVYDAIPGGVGLAARLFDLRASIWSAVRALVAQCPCGEGCPACIGPSVGGPAVVHSEALNEALREKARPVRKAVAMALLGAMGT